MDRAGGMAGRRLGSAAVSLAAAALAVLLPVLRGGGSGVLLLVAAAASAAVTAAALWWAVTRRGLVRAAAVLLTVATPAALIALAVAEDLLWPIVLSWLLWGMAVWSGRYAVHGTGTGTRAVGTPELRTTAPQRPFIVMNPRSGGGKVARFGLQEKAERLGARVVLLDPAQHQDVTALARAAVADGADLLGVAGGDGTQALVAAVAAEHNLPFLVICAGTRNHFAMDLGLDRDDPAACLDALTDGVEVRVDLGFAGDRPFVNNASFGVYAALVQSPAYRDDKFGTVLDLLPDLLTHHRGPRLTARAGDTTLAGPQAVLVSNNPYRQDDPAGLGRRDRLDSGLLGVLGVTVDNAMQAVGLLGPEAEGLTILTAREVVVEADRAHIDVGVDGEALTMPVPLRCRIAPGALRIRVPGERTGTRRAQRAAGVPGSAIRCRPGRPWDRGARDASRVDR